MDIVHPHVAQLMIDTSVNQFCKIWPSADWPYESFVKQDPLTGPGSLSQLAILVQLPTGLAMGDH